MVVIPKSWFLYFLSLLWQLSSLRNSNYHYYQEYLKLMGPYFLSCQCMVHICPNNFSTDTEQNGKGPSFFPFENTCMQLIIAYRTLDNTSYIPNWLFLVFGYPPALVMMRLKPNTIEKKHRVSERKSHQEPTLDNQLGQFSWSGFLRLIKKLGVRVFPLARECSSVGIISPLNGGLQLSWVYSG